MKTGSCSRMAKECQDCPDKDNCNNKRREAMAYIIPSAQPMSEITQSPCSAPSPTINILMPTMEDLNKQISESIARKINICGFGELRIGR